MKKFASLTLAGMMSVSAFAQTEGSNAAEDTKAEVPQMVQMLQVADQLTQYGYEQQDALPLIQAISIYQTYTGSEMEGASKTTEEGEATAEGTKTERPAQTIEQMIQDATTFADGDENLLALINELKSSATRGPVSSYSTHYDRVSAHSTDTYRVRFRGGERAGCTVVGDHDTDLDLFIYDENGNLITSDTDNTDICVCTWNPRWTGDFIIKIKNYGNVYNAYSLRVY